MRTSKLIGSLCVCGWIVLSLFLECECYRDVEVLGPLGLEDGLKEKKHL